MRREGYTLAEVMAAILILGLAFTALFQGMSVIRKQQVQTARRAAEGSAGGTARAALSRLLAQPGSPSVALPDRLSGDAAGLTVQCAAAPCGLRVAQDGDTAVLVSTVSGAAAERPLHGVRRAALRYITTDGEFDRWPVRSQGSARLLAIAVVDEAAGASPLATVRLWSQQPQTCQFDVIAAKCRPPLP